MPPSFTGAVRDSLSNLAASLGAGKDKAASDSFVLFELDRAEIEAMHRGDWLARKVVDIVPADMVREWRQWSGHRADVARVEAAERRLGLRKAVQRAMVLGRLYGGGALLIGTCETDPAALARPLDPDTLPRGGLKFLHAVSRWQLSVPAVDRDPTSPWYGEALYYDVVAPERGALRLHPSRVVRFLGNPYPDPSLMASVWSDSVLQALYDAVHAVALTTAGATSLMHEAKVDVVTVPNLSEHLSSSETTAQLSARFAYAAAMKSINNLLLLGDGETWSRQRVDFAGLPEMVRTFLQVAAGAADIPVTRLLGQSPAGLSATGESDTRNYYDMIAARQELDLRPQLERLDRLILRSEGLEPEALSFAFRPLWQMDAATAATVALQKAQTTQIYAGLGLWQTAVTARLVEAQLAEDGTYPGAETVFAVRPAALDAPVDQRAITDFDPSQPRDPDGRWSGGVATSVSPETITAVRTGGAQPTRPPSATGGILGLLNVLNPIGAAQAQEIEPEEENRGSAEPTETTELQPGEELRLQRFNAAWQALRELDPKSQALAFLRPPGEVPTDAEIESLERATRELVAARACSPLDPSGLPTEAQPGASVPLRTLASIKVPVGLTLNARGETIKQRADDYAEEARKTLAFDLAPPTYKEGESRPDGVTEDYDTGAQIALEVKYLSNFERGLRTPSRNVSFIDQKDVDQARKYLDEFKGGLLWVTNNAELAGKYERLFGENRLSGFRVVVIPSRED